jgi:hypothetical protein
MPTLAEYIAESEQHDQDDLDLVPEDLRSQINSQLDAAADGDATEPQ